MASLLDKFASALAHHLVASLAHDEGDEGEESIDPQVLARLLDVEDGDEEAVAGDHAGEDGAEGKTAHPLLTRMSRAGKKRTGATGMKALSPASPLGVSHKVSTNPINLPDLIMNFHQAMHAMLDELEGLPPGWVLTLRLWNEGMIQGVTMPAGSASVLLERFSYNGEYSLLVIAAHPAIDEEVLGMVFGRWLDSAQKLYAMFSAVGDGPDTAAPPAAEEDQPPAQDAGPGFTVQSGEDDDPRLPRPAPVG